MKALTEAQENLLRALRPPVAFEYLDDAEFIRIEDVLSCKMQTHGINEAGTG